MMTTFTITSNRQGFEKEESYQCEEVKKMYV
jgi:hypothetical protein